MRTASGSSDSSSSLGSSPTRVVRFSGDVDKREMQKRERFRKEKHHKKVHIEQSEHEKSSRAGVGTRKTVNITTPAKAAMKTGTGVPSTQKKLVKLATMAFSRRTAEA